MQIEDTKRWHWIVIGLVAGLGLSYLYASLEPGSIGRVTTTSQAAFERMLNNPPLQGQHPWVRDVVVHPPRGSLTTVTGYRLDRRTMAYHPFAFRTEQPYRPLPRPQGNRPNDWEQREQQTVREYLQHMTDRHEHVTFKYAWHREPRYVYLIWTTGSLILIGGIWPTVLGLLTGAGFGRQREPEPAYDLDRFQGGEDPAFQTTKAEPTQEDVDQLAAAEAELERRLAAHASDGSADQPQEQPTEQPVRKLEGGPVEQTAAARQAAAEKAYAGQFYPTVAHVPKKKG